MGRLVHLKEIPMKRTMAALFVFAAIPAHAEGLTVEQCISTLTGLNALNCAGMQLGGSCDKDSKSYKLGDARYTIAMDIAALGPVFDAAQQAQRKFILELPALPDAKAADYTEKSTKQSARISENWAAIMAKPCNVQPGHLKLSELHLGDSPDQNAIPPSVLAAFAPIVDK
jgi:hypothetical protein